MVAEKPIPRLLPCRASGYTACSGDTSETDPTVLPHVFYEKIGLGLRETQTVMDEIGAIQVDNDEGHDMSRWTAMSNCRTDRHRRIIEVKTGIIGSYYSVQKKRQGQQPRRMTDRVTPQA